MGDADLCDLDFADCDLSDPGDLEDFGDLDDLEALVLATGEGDLGDLLATVAGILRVSLIISNNLALLYLLVPSVHSVIS